MARDGNGIYNLAPLNPVVPNTDILAEWANDSLADVRDALTASIAKDGQTVPTADLPMGTFKHTNCGNATARNQYATLGQVQQGDTTKDLGMVTGLDANNLTGTTTPTFNGLVQGQIFTFRKDSLPNTGPAALAINGMAQVLIQRPDGTQLQAGDLPAFSYVMVQYTFGALVLLNQPKLLPTGPGSGLNADLLDGLDSTFFARNANPAFTGSGSITGNFSAVGNVFAQTPVYGDNSSALANTNHVLGALNTRIGTINGVPMMMHINAAPPGWTRWIIADNHAIRVNSSGTMTTGGAIGFTTAFSMRASEATALSVDQLPPHNAGSLITSSSQAAAAVGNNVPNAWSTVNIGSGNGHSHNMNLAVAYIDMGLFIKD